MTSTINSITVFCGSGFGTDPIFKSEAQVLGKMMADRGIRLVYGGGNKGLMGVMAETVAENGGRCWDYSAGDGEGFVWTKIEGMSMAGETIFDMHTRKATMNKHCDAFIALPGGHGTFEELLEVVTWSQLSIHAKPIIVINVHHFYDPLKQLLDNGVTKGFIRSENRNIMVFVDSAKEALDAVDAYRKTTGAYPINWEDGTDKPV
ncbi:hypothetical protein BC829DRAFT_390886 [Chytridium lagenaria]|nr:hypothetical protein BC829DRAFT_390886 [Chytridium lagenaria]